MSYKKSSYNRPPRDITVQRCLFRKSKIKGNFRILSYNILADSLLYKNIYLYVSYQKSKLSKDKQPYYFEWEYRKDLLLQQILGVRKTFNKSKNPQLYDRLQYSNEQLVSSDIICLQEVDHYIELEEEFNKNNYSGIFKKRTGERNDGCAIFYNNNNIKLLDHHIIEFNRSLVNPLPLLSNSIQEYDNKLNNIFNQKPKRIQILLNNDTKKIECSEELEEVTTSNTLLDRDNIALIGLFQLKNNPKKLICVANTHLLFNPKRGDIKLLQIDLLNNEIIAFLKQKNLSYHTTPIFICGDFNSSNESLIYKYMYKEPITINPSFPFWHYTISGLHNKIPKYNIVDSLEELEIKINSNYDSSKETIEEYYQKESYKNYFLRTFKDNITDEEFFHNIPFSSAYLHNNNEPFCTTLHKQSHEIVDYIWHTPNARKIQTLQISHLSDDNLLLRVLPNRYHPSDHFMLAGEFDI